MKKGEWWAPSQQFATQLDKNLGGLDRQIRGVKITDMYANVVEVSVHGRTWKLSKKAAAEALVSRNQNGRRV